MSYGASFAPAQFTDDNASGLTPKPFRAITNLCTVHMNDASQWNVQIQKLLDTYETAWLDRMVKPVETLDRVVQLDSIVKKLAHPLFNPSATWISQSTPASCHRCGNYFDNWSFSHGLLFDNSSSSGGIQ